MIYILPNLRKEQPIKIVTNDYKVDLDEKNMELTISKNIYLTEKEKNELITKLEMRGKLKWQIENIIDGWLMGGNFDLSMKKDANKFLECCVDDIMKEIDEEICKPQLF